VLPSELWAAYEKAAASGDWNGVRACLADDVVAIDHRPLGFGEIRGADALVQYARGMRELVPGASPRQRELIEETERGSARVVEVHGGPQDAPIGLEYIMVGELRDGRTTRLWYYPVDAREEALRTLAAL
jgi:ketosteroid isomerase-like protein